MTQQDDFRHNLRMPGELRIKLSHARIDAGRSMNAEIVARLEASFLPDPAARIVEALAPIASLGDEDRRAAARLIAELGKLLSK